MLIVLPAEALPGMLSRIRGGLDRFFGIGARSSSVRTEVTAGATTYLSLMYIIVVNPAILAAAGVPPAAAVIATIASACFGTLLMGLYANRPFAVAPFMGQNALAVYILAGTLHYPWPAVMGATLVSGLVFTVFVLSGAWKPYVLAIPESIMRACARGLGLFIAFIGYTQSGVVIRTAVAGSAQGVTVVNPVNLLILVASFAVIGAMMIRKIPGGIIAGIIAATVLAFVLGAAPLPAGIVATPPSSAVLPPVPDLAGALAPAMLPVVLMLFLLTLFDSSATILGLSISAGLADPVREPGEVKRPFLCNALSMAFSPIAGTSTAGMYLESAAGLSEGGRTGLTAVVVAALIAASLLFLPLVNAIPTAATSSALIVIGLLMLLPLRQRQGASLGEFLTAFVIMVTMSLTHDVGLGLCTGFIIYPVFMAAAGKVREIPPGTWLLTAISLVFLAVRPY